MYKKNSPCRAIFASGLIAVGAVFILSQLFNFSALAILWPLFILVPGAMMLSFASSGQYDDDIAWLTIPGTLTFGTGALLAYQNIFDHWESWAYAWALYGVFLGWAFIRVDQLLPNDDAADLVPIGQEFIRWSLIVFVGLAALVELLIIGGWVRRVALAIVLIAAGIYLLNRDDSESNPRADMPPYKAKKRSSNGTTPEPGMVYGLGGVHLDMDVEPQTPSRPIEDPNAPSYRV